ncbi:MAG: HAMP domain-containing protein, partial [Lachnospiraceae bacterium]|nr:HAMP domain-containing protein [Lachnospiraceae bacterium]
MRKKIKSSLYAKVFLTTMVILFGVSLLVFGLLAYWMPQTYSNRLTAALKERVQDFVTELEQVTFLESGGLFDWFVRDSEIDSVELYHSNGGLVPLPTAEFDDGWGGNYALSALAEERTATPVLSSEYYFSFADSNDRYMLLVYGAAEQVAQLQQSFARIFPLILLVVLAAAFAVSWLYSRIITKPVLAISHIAEKMSDLQLEWEVDGRRTDELGILGRSLNTLSRKLSFALSDLQSANRKLEADIEHEKKLEQSRTNFFSAVSHELKTPITIIKGQLEGMLLGIGAYKDHGKYLARALEIANTLETMVQEILTVSRLETARANFKKERLD